ncbi:alpha/beta hydrolase [Prochlorococcus sp. MIT 1223]|uniref:alpha/beta fold hydrolase n=1 Tax=Prochlorococcus sp. MIT 1223 TaxID=3096217 RepID=UPI002A74C3A4|nr:alpha/beta hydrolase [Prochlorococcus sp. MIT 1223]
MTKKEISSKQQLTQLKDKLLDPLARDLADKVKWVFLKGFSKDKDELYPIAEIGEGPPILMLHGFDSCFLEFRRIAPLLKDKHKLIIPDLYGFGFCPRPYKSNYGIDSLISHLSKVIINYENSYPFGIIGASMGGCLALDLARKNPKGIDRILLISPAGISTKQSKVPWPLDQFGTWFLKQKFVRKSLCKQAFANPNKNVGKEEEEIASIHLKVPGWQRSLATFARNGGISNLGKSNPPQPIDLIWGANDRIITKDIRKESTILLGKDLKEINECGHLPHLEMPNLVANHWHIFNQYYK